ncbi:MAG: PSD1 and planctomycete cytochrome C domain-containing protein [Planctomycetota bacterium]
MQRIHFSVVLLVMVRLVAQQPSFVCRADEATTIDFNRDIRPILSGHCFACHGPDEHDRQADVRLDTADGIADWVVPGDIDGSDLWMRMTSDDPDVLMPPPEHHKPLSAEQLSLIRVWIAEGAPYASHWAFNSIDQQHVAPDAALPAQLIDDMLVRHLASVGLDANGFEQPDKRIRRLHLSLTGLPPSVEQVDAFVASPTREAYEAAVDELLASPAFGEHWARYWLDLVRYGDTHGLHLDNYREMWPYRDWVIQAINENMPFDAFIRTQLAGDLLDSPQQSDLIASGFNRLNVTTSEGGSIYDEVFARNVIDRTDAFGTIFLGLTTGCAVCHDHKFDPITQRDYYGLSAFFNSLDGRALDGNKKDHPPVVPVPSQEQAELLQQANDEIKHLTAELNGPIELVDVDQAVWMKNPNRVSGSLPVMVELSHVAITGDATTRIVASSDDPGEEFAELSVGQDAKVDHIIEMMVPPGAWRSVILDALVDPKNKRVGTASNGNVVLSEVVFEVKRGDAPWSKLDVESAVADRNQDDGSFHIRNAIDGKLDDKTGWAVGGHQADGGRTGVFVIPELEVDGAGRVTLRATLRYQSVYAQHFFRKVRFSISQKAWTTVPSATIHYGEVHLVGPVDPNAESVDDEEPDRETPAFEERVLSRDGGKFDPEAEFEWAGRLYRWQKRGDVLPLISNTVPSLGQSSAVVLHQQIDSSSAVTADLVFGASGEYVVNLNGKELGRAKARAHQPLSKRYPMNLKPGANHLFVMLTQTTEKAQVSFAVATRNSRYSKRVVDRLNVDELSPRDQKTIRRFYREVVCELPEYQSLVDMKKGAEKLRDKLNTEIPTTLVWKETKEPRKAYILNRGQYDQPGEEVTRSVPDFLPPFSEELPRNRLGLAAWLVDPQHPLTARVAVNRFWQQLFGRGLVETSEDFGSQGTPPTHPELLDALAGGFVASGWDVKATVKQLVMTEAFQRDASQSDRKRAIDPRNQWLARGPRFRMDAEVLRDQALALSGLLIEKRGGPSVKPPQPDGLWYAVGYTRSNTARFVADIGDKVYRRSLYTFWKRTSPPAVMATMDAPSRENCTARRERTNTPLQALLMMNEPQMLEASRGLAKQTLQQDESSRAHWLFRQVLRREPSDNEHEVVRSLATDLQTHYANLPEATSELVQQTEPPLAAWTVVASTLLNLDEVVNQ